MGNPEGQGAEPDPDQAQHRVLLRPLRLAERWSEKGIRERCPEEEHEGSYIPMGINHKTHYNLIDAQQTERKHYNPIISLKYYCKIMKIQKVGTKGLYTFCYILCVHSFTVVF